MSQMATTSPKSPAWLMSLSPLPPTPMPAMRMLLVGRPADARGESGQSEEAGPDGRRCQEVAPRVTMSHDGPSGVGWCERVGGYDPGSV